MGKWDAALTAAAEAAHLGQRVGEKATAAWNGLEERGLSGEVLGVFWLWFWLWFWVVLAVVLGHFGWCFGSFWMVFWVFMKSRRARWGFGCLVFLCWVLLPKSSRCWCSVVFCWASQ